MFPDRRALSGLRSQSGSMLVIAVFVIVVMAALGLAMTRMLSASSNTVVHEVYGLRAYQAAQAGIEDMLVSAFPVSGGNQCDLTRDRSLVNVAGFENCRYSVSCSATEFPLQKKVFYHISSQGICEAGDVIASRTVFADASESLEEE